MSVNKSWTRYPSAKINFAYDVGFVAYLESVRRSFALSEEKELKPEC
jgi:hypothetical protein